MMLRVVLVPVSGSTSGIRATATGLRDLAVGIGRIGAQVQDLRTAATWESPAGERFGALLMLLPHVLDQVRHRYFAASTALVDFAGHHQRAAEETERAAVAHRAAHDEICAVEEDITRAFLDPGREAHLPQLYARQQAAVARGNAAEEDFRRAWSAFEAAAEDCRFRLRAAAEDAIVDTGTYDTLRSARSIAQAMTTTFGIAGMLPTPVKAFSTAAAGVGASVVFAGDLLLLLGYGEGSWGAALETVAWNAAGRGASTLSRAAGVGAVKGVNGRWTGESLRTGERLRRGRVELRDDLARQRAALRTPVADRERYARGAGGTRAPMLGPQQQLRTRARRMFHDRVDAKITGINDRWQMAAAGGANAVVLQASSSTIRVAAAARATEARFDGARERMPASTDRAAQR